MDGEELHRCRHVVHAHDSGAVTGPPKTGGEAAGEALGGWRAGQLADEALAAGADEQRAAERSEDVELTQQRQVVEAGLREADAGVEHHLRAVDAGGLGAGSAVASSSRTSPTASRS